MSGAREATREFKGRVTARAPEASSAMGRALLRAAVLGWMLLLPACGHSEALDPAVAKRIARNSPLPPVPPDPTNLVADKPAAAALGHRIFFDPGFSASGTVSCATCHDPRHGFADTKTIAVGEGAGTRNALSVLNAAHHRWFTWDGRADTLWAQALQPFEAPNEMHSTRAAVVARVEDNDELRRLYVQVFGPLPGKGATDAEVDRAFANIGKAIAAYERKLVTGPSAYDKWWTRYARGDEHADVELSPAARRGLDLFFGKADCWQCHHGANFTDGEFHMIGVPPAGGGAQKDQGRYAVVEGVARSPFNAGGPFSDDPKGAQSQISMRLAKNSSMWGQFRTPSLRAAVDTAPYMHQGQLPTLEAVVHFYSTLEGATALDHHRELVLRKLDLSAKEEADLVAFLKSLAGTPPEAPWNDAPEDMKPQPSGRAAVKGAP